MLRSLAVASALAVGAFAFGGQGASAAMSVPTQTQTENAVEQVQYRYCRRWNRECRERHGGGGDYRRCMRRHGC